MDKLQEAVNTVLECGGNKTEAAKRLGIPRTTLRERLNSAESKGIAPTVGIVQRPETQEQAAPKFEVKEKENTTEIWSVGDSVRTVDDAIAKAEIDLKCWEIVEKVVNSWPTTMKITSKADGVQVEKPEQVWNWQVKIKLRRKAPKIVQEGIKELLAELPKVKWPSVKRGKRSQTHLMEVSLYDCHFGKLCWGEETYTDYDLQIAEQDFLQAVDELIDLNTGYNIDRIVLPVGNDFFQIDNWAGTTAKGTPVDSVDDRFQKVFVCGCRAWRHAILRAREVAKTEVIWVPGNHDPSTSWYLCHYLSGIFENDKHVSVHLGAAKRKYLSYGVNLLGYAHGDSCKLDKLPLIMATDEPELWSRCHTRAWRTGDKHTKRKYQFAATGDTFNGVHINIMPSISGTDKWHFDHGFVNNARTAEAWFWSKENGYRGHQSVATRSQKDQWENPISRAIQV